MTSSEPIKSPATYPIQFTVALPVEECVHRIRESLGKVTGMEFAIMQGHIEKIDETTYEFLLYQNLRFGGGAIRGRFIAATSSSTQVDASFQYSTSTKGISPEREKISHTHHRCFNYHLWFDDAYACGTNHYGAYCDCGWAYSLY